MNIDWLKKSSVLLVLVMLVFGLVFVSGCQADLEEVMDADDEPTEEEPVEAGEPQFGGTLRHAMSSDISTISPYITEWQSHEVTRNVVEGLLTVDEGLKIQPGLAREYEVSEDGMVYTFYLHEGVLFHNGQEMTADDVVYSFEKMMESPIAGNFDVVTGVDAIDEYTVQITTSEVSGPFLMNIAHPYTAAIIPSGIIEEQGGELEHLIGTGPFEFVEWVPDRHVHIVRFDDYWGGEGDPSGTFGEKVAYLDEVYFVPTAEVASRMVGLETGDLDIAFIPGKEIDRLVEQPNLEAAMTGPTYEFWNYWFNVGRAPFDDINFRRAVAHAINREDVLMAAADGFGAVVNSPYSSISAWYTPEHAIEWEYDMDKAMEYLEASSYDGEKVYITTFSGYTAMDRMGVIAESILQGMGIDAELQYMEWSALFDSFWNGDYHMLCYGYGAFPDPDAWYYTRLHSAQNTCNWENAEFDALVEEARQTVDFETRKALYARAQEIVMEELPTLPTISEEYVYVHNSRINDFDPWNAVFTRYYNVWVSE